MEGVVAGHSMVVESPGWSRLRMPVSPVVWGGGAAWRRYRYLCQAEFARLRDECLRAAVLSSDKYRFSIQVDPIKTVLMILGSSDAIERSRYPAWKHPESKEVAATVESKEVAATAESKEVAATAESKEVAAMAESKENCRDGRVQG